DVRKQEGKQHPRGGDGRARQPIDLGGQPDEEHEVAEHRDEATEPQQRVVPLAEDAEHLADQPNGFTTMSKMKSRMISGSNQCGTRATGASAAAASPGEGAASALSAAAWATRATQGALKTIPA